MKTRAFFLILTAALLCMQGSAQTLLPRPEAASIDPAHKVTVNSRKTVFKNIPKNQRVSLTTCLADLPAPNGGRRITLQLTAPVAPADECDRQAYALTADKNGVRITAQAVQGLFYGLQTLRQLTDSLGQVPYANITDRPRFDYRGLMLDCSRHFWTKEFILKQIDAMAAVKLNRLHLHLTDAAGWRIEIKRYPQLTQRGAWRTESDWDKWWVFGKREYTEPGQGYGGFYTQQDLRDIVAYAAQRHITVIPEVEMPGHSEEVCFALPEVSCTGQPYGSGDLCVGKERTFQVLQDILDEVMDIFPSEYIHIGGDEASRKAWETCPDCQRRMREEHLSTTAELQSYLTERIERYLNAHGRQLLGWDEILEGKLAPNATVMSWRGTEGGLKAVHMGHKVVMTPGSYCYLDSYQDAPMTQPKAFGGYNPLEHVYSYDPVPDSLKGSPAEKLFLGVQGNVWTEMIPTPEQYEFMIYPRILALAEIGWSKEKSAYADFRLRAMAVNDGLRAKGYHAFDLHQEVGRREESRQPIQHLAVGAKVRYIGPYHEAYKASGDNALVDGMRGNWQFSDGRWQGFISRNRFDVVIDLGEVMPISEVSAHFMQFAGPEIFSPASVAVSVSADDADYQMLYEQNFEVDASKPYFIQPYGWKGSTQARYIRFKATSGQYGGWLFTDEVVVR